MRRKSCTKCQGSGTVTATSPTPCCAHEITWSANGYKCLNCGASADHSWNIVHNTKPCPKCSGTGQEVVDSK